MAFPLGVGVGMVTSVISVRDYTRYVFMQVNVAYIEHSKPTN